MKTLRPTALVLGIAACASVALCMLTDWNDAMFLPLGLCLSAAANLLNALAVKTLSTLDEERRRFAVLYRLGADEKMQKSALLRQTGAFFLMPFAFPFLMTVPLGVIFGKVYAFWDFQGLNGQKAMETALLIGLVMAGVYALYFFITYRIACGNVICSGPDSARDGRSL